VSGQDGRFDLPPLPAGSYTLKAGHERLGTATQQVTVWENQTKTVESVFKVGPGA
jgi:hypothetical protein